MQKDSFDSFAKKHLQRCCITELQFVDITFNYIKYCLNNNISPIKKGHVILKLHNMLNGSISIKETSNNTFEVTSVSGFKLIP